MTTIQLARYRFDFKVTTVIRLPEYAGSMLRGAFGHALRRTACMTKEKDCKACPLYRSCPYPMIFETPAPEQHSLQKFSQIPNPYVIEPPAWGERVYMEGEILSFHMVLVGRAVDQLALVTFAWQRAFAREIGHGTAELQDVLLCDQQGEHSIYERRKNQLATHSTEQTPPESLPSSLTLHFTTPLRLQNNGRVIMPRNLAARDLLVALVRRVSLLLEFHTASTVERDFSQLAALAEQVRYEHDLTWLDWTRYSSRQQQTMQLGGGVGRWTLYDLPAELHEFIHWGQWLHIGKNASFGLGCYHLAPLTAE
jgi:hypothetical protein